MFVRGTYFWKFRNYVIYQSPVDLPSLSAPKPHETVWFSIAISDLLLLLNYNNLVLKDLKKICYSKAHINQYSIKSIKLL